MQEEMRWFQIGSSVLLRYAARFGLGRQPIENDSGGGNFPLHGSRKKFNGFNIRTAFQDRESSTRREACREPTFDSARKAPAQIDRLAMNWVPIWSTASAKD